MVFSVPKVQVADPPFDVRLQVAHTCHHSDQLELTIEVVNRRWSSEHLVLTVAGVNDDTPPTGFLLVGSAKALLDLSPQGTCTIRLSLLPLHTGFAPLPHVRVTWERNNATVAEIGSSTAPRHVFVRP
jgi:hypothetical protein